MIDEMQKLARAEIQAAVEIHKPVAIFAAYSGGNDSIVSTHAAQAVIKGVPVLHIDTGIGIPKTLRHVRGVAREFGWNLREQRTKAECSPEERPLSENPYDQLSLNWGFPGPGMHGKMYQRLKERAIRQVMREAKQGHSKRRSILIISGIRHDESRIRAGYQRTISKVDSQVWLNPLYRCSFDDFRDYMRRHSLPRNPVKDIVGISGECLCGSMAQENEFWMVEKACDQTAERIDRLSVRVAANGFPWGWGQRPPKAWLDSQRGQQFLFQTRHDCKLRTGPMCHSCDKVGPLAHGHTKEPAPC